MDDYQKYLDPEVLARISGLDLKARLIVEGFVSGLHRSPYHGFSVEFAEHREYVPGDDLRHVSSPALRGMVRFPAFLRSTQPRLYGVPEFRQRQCQRYQR